jgi:regulation of enolase protein 1 (concanavalin A-like superfamily)
MEGVSLPTIPHTLSWDNPPAAWKHVNKRLSIGAGPQTDLFRDPQGKVVMTNSPRLLFEPDSGDFVFSARVEVDFNSDFDAGVLVIYGDEQSWAKLCFEFSPQQQPMIVSVVTRGLSDDCNSVPIQDNNVFLRLARIGQAFAFFYSTDGEYWHLVRHFSLGEPGAIKVGFSTQAPRGEGCTARFGYITYAQRTIANIRSGE